MGKTPPNWCFAAIRASTNIWPIGHIIMYRPIGLWAISFLIGSFFQFLTLPISGHFLDFGLRGIWLLAHPLFLGCSGPFRPPMASTARRLSQGAAHQPPIPGGPTSAASLAQGPKKHRLAIHTHTPQYSTRGQ
ncbi:hypothetical protein O181_055509, partial [Austropuccinia psidii MF-1]|nr:hypothetical protein [Austropuccinia psidii MF-1]